MLGEGDVKAVVDAMPDLEGNLDRAGKEAMVIIARRRRAANGLKERRRRAARFAQRPLCERPEIAP